MERICGYASMRSIFNQEDITESVEQQFEYKSETEKSKEEKKRDSFIDLLVNLIKKYGLELPKTENKEDKQYVS